MTSLKQMLGPEEAAQSFGLVLLDIRDVLLELALGESQPERQTNPATAPASLAQEKRTADKTLDRVIQADARRCLLVGLPVFYPVREKQSAFLHELLATLEREGKTPSAESHQETSIPVSAARLLLDELLEQLSQEQALDLADMLFVPLDDETIASTTSEDQPLQSHDALPSLAPSVPHHRTSTKESVAECEDDKADLKGKGFGARTKESSEHAVRGLMQLAAELIHKGSEDAKSKKMRMQEEVKAVLFEVEGATAGLTKAEEASTIYNVLLAIQRDLLSRIGIVSGGLARDTERNCDDKSDDAGGK